MLFIGAAAHAASPGAYWRRRRRDDWVEATTGPAMLLAAVQSFRRHHQDGLTVLGPGGIYPINWRDTNQLEHAGPEASELVICTPNNKHFDNAACRARFPDAFAITYWSHSWAEGAYGRR